MATPLERDRKLVGVGIFQDLGDFHGRFLIYSLDLCTLNGHNTPLIKSFADKETEKVYNQVFSPEASSRYSASGTAIIDYD